MSRRYLLLITISLNLNKAYQRTRNSMKKMHVPWLLSSGKFTLIVETLLSKCKIKFSNHIKQVKFAFIREKKMELFELIYKVID